MKYCLVLSVGYGVALLTLWTALSLAWGLVDFNALGFLPYGAILSALVAILGALVNCTFEALGNLLGVEPPTSVLAGWTLVMFTYFVITNPPPAGLGEFVWAVGRAAMFVSNAFPASDLFYELGNFTLTAVGLR
ncbi:hypothetical protein Igni_0032 [Ignicoccus hospitalis KIN4/I]|uniref:Uncharacterized protein n=1 Tax=Ignicoccus hospitalis (strain KIN4/I / DSM 18386 / JCM 14125) TaxID=453591 RepID=A8A8G4_IGNH4|nr:hypothetical protein Igni_0032 [Ignicoccus hospitalis KIN4/I]